MNFDVNLILKRRYGILNFHNFQQNISWTVDICKCVSWCHRLAIFPLILFTEMDKNPIFQLWESKTCYIFTLNKCRIMFALIWGYAFTYLSKYEQFWWLICILLLTLQEMFHWKFQSVISSLFFIRFTSNCQSSVQNIYSFYWINLNLDRISPIKRG